MSGALTMFPLLPIFFASSMVDLGLSKAVCPDGEYLIQPFSCSEPAPGGLSAPMSWGLSSFVVSYSSCVLAAPIVLGISSPFASSIAFTVLVAVWCLVGLVGYGLIAPQR